MYEEKSIFGLRSQRAKISDMEVNTPASPMAALTTPSDLKSEIYTDTKSLNSIHIYSPHLEMDQKFLSGYF